jgi:hypothetical protein
MPIRRHILIALTSYRKAVILGSCMNWLPDSHLISYLAILTLFPDVYRGVCPKGSLDFEGLPPCPDCTIERETLPKVDHDQDAASIRIALFSFYMKRPSMSSAQGCLDPSF